MRIILTSLLVLFALTSFTQTNQWESKLPVDLSNYAVDLPHLENLQCFEVTYWSDSIKVKGILLEPKKEGVYPAIIFNRGGNREFAELSSEMIIDVLGRVASDGYVITASNYRWEDEFGGADTNDVLNLMKVTKRLSNVDSTRIGMMGWSRGAMMTCLALRGQHGIKSSVLVSGAPNLFESIQERPILDEKLFSVYIPNYRQNKTAELTARSPHFWAEKLDRGTSLLILNGTKDRRVNYRQSEAFSRRLDSIHFPHQFHTFETNHAFSNMRSELDEMLLHWFNKTLKQGGKRVAITIDDVPNTRNFEQNQYQSKLMDELDSLNLPVTIFINEGKLEYGKKKKNVELLSDWISREYATAANHTYGHSRYSDVGYEEFVKDIQKGEKYTRPLAKKNDKELRYFRFPFNDLGKDSSEHVQIADFLSSSQYISTPFSVETSDWMFNAVYEKYINQGELEKAKQIGEMYVNETIRTFAFFDSLMRRQYGRNVDQIYLCHDNRLNEDYLSSLVDRLDSVGYEFVSLDEAMKDEVYSQEDTYWKKWGISWCYRWMNPDERRPNMMKEPNLGGIEELYQKETYEK